MLTYQTSDPVLSQVLSQFSLPETLLGAVRYGQGHINDTYCVVCQPQEGDAIRYILQRINSNVFPDPHALMENFVGITSFLKEKITTVGGDPARETLGLVPTKDGKPYYTDEQGQVWRLMPFVENTVCYQTATPELFEASARAFGRFQNLLQDYPAQTLNETIVKFHDTKNRFDKFCQAVKQDAMGRAASVQAEIQFVMDREADCSVAVNALAEGKLPLRVTHNDTKLNNILFDKESGEGLCVIDLDTVMPGLAANDFGDSIRFGANHSAEDEPDLSKVNFAIDLFEIYTKGYLQAAGDAFTPLEKETLPWGAKLMTLECGIRFLTDYLEGDHYFHTTRPGQNLDRARTQFKLVQDMEGCWDQMEAIVKKYC